MTCKTSEPHSGGNAWAAIVTDTLSNAQVKSSAMTPAIRPSRALSVSNCRMRRRRLAPRERRRHSSLWREAARASCRLATLAQAMTSTIPTATMRNRMASFNPLSRSRGNGEPGQTSAVTGLLNSECGSCRVRSWLATAVISACAWPMPTPGARRPKSRHH